MKKSFIVLSLVLTLSGCGTLQQVAKNALKSPIEKAQDYCTQIGYTQNTNEMRQCVTITANRISAQREAEHQQFMSDLKKNSETRRIGPQNCYINQGYIYCPN